MKPIKFTEQNCVYAKDQPEYLPLPVHKTEDGMVISCWALTWRERLRVLLTGRMWWSVLTFNHPLQPQSPQVESPLVAEALRDLVEEYEDRKVQFGGDYLWEKHEDTDTLPTAQNALKRWDEANANAHSSRVSAAKEG